MNYVVYAGTYTDGVGTGIYAAHFDSERRELRPLGVVAEVQAGSFLCMHPRLPILYGVSEVSSYEGSGAVLAWRIRPEDGRPALLSRRSTRGAGPCHVTIDDAGTLLIAANYGESSVASFRVFDDGSLSEALSFLRQEGSGPDVRRQAKAHAHQVAWTPDGRHVICPDLGADRLYLYARDQNAGELRAGQPAFIETRPGMGPRHIAFAPSGQYGYVLGELDRTIAVYAVRSAPFRVTLREIVRLPDVVAGELPAEIVVNSSGRFLYCSLRGSNELLVFAVAADGRLSHMQTISSGGAGPRHFTLDSAEEYLLVTNTDADEVRVFGRDPDDGRLSSTAMRWSVPRPACVVLFAADANFYAMHSWAQGSPEL